MNVPRVSAPERPAVPGVAVDTVSSLPPLERGLIGMPKPQGWAIERIVSLLAGLGVIVSLGLARRWSNRWRLLAGFVGVNLVLDGTVGWCPVSLMLHRLGVPSASERSRRPD